MAGQSGSRADRSGPALAAQATAARSDQGWHALAGRPAARWRATAAAAVLAAAIVGWAAFPLSGGGAGTRVALIAAIVCAVLSVAQLTVAQIPVMDAPALGSIADRVADRLLSFLRSVQWAEGLLLAALALAALRPAQPRHTGVLGVALLAYLFAVHLAETSASPRVLRPQLPIIAAGIGLLALAVGAALLPGLHSAAGGSLIRGVAIVAAVVVAAISVPTWARRR